jgi:ribose transport system substrate-binding protein
MDLENDNYWLRNKLSRRRLLTGAAVTGVGAAGLALVGCGDDDSTAATGSSTAASSPAANAINAPEVTTKIADAQFIKLMGTAQVDPLVARSMNRASVNFTDAQKATAVKIFKGSGGDTGSGGKLVLGISEGANNAFAKATFMEGILQAMSYPAIGKVIYTNSNYDNQKQISDMQTLISQKVDIIAIAGGATLLPIMKEATKAGIPVSAYIGDPTGTPGTDYVSYVSYSIEAVGKAFGQAAVDYTGGNGNYVVFNGIPGNAFGAVWIPALDTFYKSQPGMKKIGQTDTNWTVEGTFAATSSFLAKESKIDVWHSDFAGVSTGIFQAYDQAKRPIECLITCAGEEQGLFGEYEKRAAASPKLKIAHGTGGTWQIRVCITSLMDVKAGLKVAAKPTIPNVFRIYKTGDGFDASLPADIPLGRLIPDDLVKQMFA